MAQPGGQPSEGRRTMRLRVVAVVAFISGLIGFLSAVIPLVFFVAEDSWRLFVWWDDTSAEIVDVRRAPTNNDRDPNRAVEVTVDCHTLEYEEELWLVVWKQGDSETSELWPVTNESDCKTWTRPFNVGEEGERGQFQIRLYAVESDDTSRWVSARDGDRPLFTEAAPEDDPLSVKPYERPD